MASHNKKQESQRFRSYKEENYSNPSQELKNWSYSESLNKDKYYRPIESYINVSSTNNYENFNTENNLNQISTKNYLDSNLPNSYQNYSSNISNNQNLWNSQNHSTQYLSYAQNTQVNPNNFVDSIQMNYQSQNTSNQGNNNNLQNPTIENKASMNSGLTIERSYQSEIRSTASIKRIQNNPSSPQPKKRTSSISTTIAPIHETSSTVYKKIGQVGEGTYGKVYKAVNQISGQLVALKRLRLESEREGFPITALREIKLLQSIRCERVVQLIELLSTDDSLCMVFEYLDYDLTGLLAHPTLLLNETHIKRLMYQLLEGLDYLHTHNIVHRDLKGSNILLSKNGDLKIADFGLARSFHNKCNWEMTNRVITLWYRPPEVLMGATQYKSEIDMWGAGCIFMELFDRKAIFQGNSEISQLNRIFSIMGTPTVETWPSIQTLPWYSFIMPTQEYTDTFRETYQRKLSPECLNLAYCLLSMDPTTRISARKALHHPYFTLEKPSVQNCDPFPNLDGDWHEFELKNRRNKNGELSDNRSEKNRTPLKDGEHDYNENFNQSSPNHQSPHYPPKVPRDIVKTPQCADNNDYHEIIENSQYDNTNDSQNPCFSPPLLSNSPIQNQRTYSNNRAIGDSSQDRYKVRSSNNSGISPNRSFSPVHLSSTSPDTFHSTVGRKTVPKQPVSRLSSRSSSYSNNSGSLSYSRSVSHSRSRSPSLRSRSRSHSPSRSRSKSPYDFRSRSSSKRRSSRSRSHSRSHFRSRSRSHSNTPTRHSTYHPHTHKNHNRSDRGESRDVDRSYQVSSDYRDFHKDFPNYRSRRRPSQNVDHRDRFQSFRNRDRESHRERGGRGDDHFHNRRHFHSSNRSRSRERHSSRHY